MHVETRDDRRLGRVHDLRIEQGKSSPGRATYLLYGAQGLAERLGVQRRSPEKLPWSAIVAIRGDVMVVDDGAVSRGR